MPKFSGPDDVYQELVDQAGESWLAMSEITIRRAREIALKVSRDSGDSKAAKKAAGRVMSGPTTTVVDKALKGPGPSRAECRAAALAMAQTPKY